MPDSDATPMIRSASSSLKFLRIRRIISGLPVSKPKSVSTIPARASLRSISSVIFSRISIMPLNWTPPSDRVRDQEVGKALQLLQVAVDERIVEVDAQRAAGIRCSRVELDFLVDAFRRPRR